MYKKLLLALLFTSMVLILPPSVYACEDYDDVEVIPRNMHLQFMPQFSTDEEGRINGDEVTEWINSLETTEFPFQPYYLPNENPSLTVVIEKSYPDWIPIIFVFDFLGNIIDDIDEEYFIENFSDILYLSGVYDFNISMLSSNVEELSDSRRIPNYSADSMVGFSSSNCSRTGGACSSNRMYMGSTPHSITADTCSGSITRRFAHICSFCGRLMSESWEVHRNFHSFREGPNGTSCTTCGWIVR